MTGNYYRFWLHAGELQPTIRTEDGFLELAHPRGIAILGPSHCSMCRLGHKGHDDLTSSSPSSGLSPAVCSGFQTQLSVSAQQSAFVVGVLSDLYAFHCSTGNSLCPTVLQLGSFHHLSRVEPWDLMAKLKKPPTDALRPIILDNACILCLTAAAGTELADAYSPDTVIPSSPGKKLTTVGLLPPRGIARQAFAHCGKFPPRLP
ncbi:hypothetical protein K1719_032711 [Acacia pycnantha]|nr:hypothetical protein K1719_032711 [Acacia pycnantha]